MTNNQHQRYGKAPKLTEEQRQAIVSLRTDTEGRGSDYIHALIFKDPEQYGFDAAYIPSINRIQNVLRDEGLINQQSRKTLTLSKFGMKHNFKTPFGKLNVSIERGGVVVTDGKSSFTFFKG